MGRDLTGALRRDEQEHGSRGYCRRRAYLRWRWWPASILKLVKDDPRALALYENARNTSGTVARPDFLFVSPERPALIAALERLKSQLPQESSVSAR